ncbi:MAG TPA: solute carrier family 23 protein [Acidobacteriaceae bacterium]|nr:solute carrier family 23 protein [Acidobacteriaceae bacterium]
MTTQPVEPPRGAGVGPLRREQHLRPPDLIYGLDERPPLTPLILLGAQHVAVICPYLVFVTLIAQAGGASTAVTSHAVALGMIAIALATLLQGHRLGPVGSGYLAPPVVSAIYFAPALEAAHRGGLALVCGMIAFAGVFEAIFAWALPRMRRVFPPVVSGFIVIAVGAELGLIGVSGFLGISDLHDPHLATHIAAAGLTLAVMVGFGVWGKGLPRLLCGLIGLALGMAIAVAVGMVTSKDVAIIASRPWFALPDPRFLSYRFEPSLMLPFAIAGLASGLRAIGVITTCQKINNAAWRRPDLDNIRSGVLADGVACFVGGWLATPGLSAAPSLVGIQKVTGATSRYIVYAIAGWLVLLSCVPKVGAALLALPLPIIGAALVFNGASMLMGGIQIVTSRPVTMRSTFIVGISLLFALSRRVYPEFYALLPSWTHAFTDSILSIAVVVCLLLNLCFLLGERRTEIMVLEPGDGKGLSRFDDKLRAQAKLWQLTAADAARAETSISELLRLIVEGGHADSPITASVSYDDLDLAIKLSYKGTLPYVASEQRLPGKMVEEQIFAVGLSGFLSSVFPDRLNTQQNDGACEISLYFQT